MDTNEHEFNRRERRERRRRPGMSYIVISLDQYHLAVISPFPPFAPVNSVLICVHLWLFPFDLALVSPRSSRLCGEIISNHSVNSSGFFLSHFSVPNFSVSQLNSPLHLL